MENTDSQLMASAFNKSHQSVMKVIEGHRSEFEAVGALKEVIEKNTHGKPSRKYILSEQHVTVYALIAGNNAEIKKFKKKFVAELSRMRKYNKTGE